MNEIERGTQVNWRGVNRTETGVVISKEEMGYLVKLNNGRAVIVPEESIKLQ